MILHVFSRHALLDTPCDPQQPALLLEGSWPAQEASASRWALDDALDARFAWIDQEAARLAEQLAADSVVEEAASIARSVAPAWLNALGLRYYLVKLLRVVVFFSEIQPLRPGDVLRVLARQGCDEDYAELLEQLAPLAGTNCQVRWTGRGPAPSEPLPADARWRRWAARLCTWLGPRVGRGDLRRRLVLCGNPRILAPVCREALTQDVAVWWLYDRLAVKSWLRWRLRGVGQLVCNASQGRQNRLRHRLAVPCQFRGVALGNIVGQWLQRRLELHGARQTRLLEEIERHLHRVQPDALVLDEDATPVTRAAVAVARRQGIASLVVQHGAPACRFGFTPVAADRLLAWGEAARRQFERWGVAREQILVTGSPYHDELGTRLRRPATSKSRTPRILLLATVPPRDERPDALEVRLTRTTHQGMLEAAFAAVADLPEAELIVKLHPRAAADPAIEAVQAQFPQVSMQMVQVEPLEHWLGAVDCVLSCLSSAGIDATLAGVPVVQLLPAGCGDLLPAADWGLLGSARTAEELQPLLIEALSKKPNRSAPPNPQVFANAGQASARVVEAALGREKESDLQLPSPACGRGKVASLRPLHKSLIPNP